VKTSPKRYENVDWLRVREALVLRALQLSRACDRVVDGATFEDLADQVMTEFLLHPDGMDWDPKKGPLEMFLRKTLDHRWVDGWRRHSKNEQAPVEQPVNPQAELEHDQFFEMIKRALEDQGDLLEVIEAVEILDGDYNIVNQEVAKLIGTTVKEVENRKKRLRRALTGLRI